MRQCDWASADKRCKCTYPINEYEEHNCCQDGADITCNRSSPSLGYSTNQQENDEVKEAAQRYGEARRARHTKRQGLSVDRQCARKRNQKYYMRKDTDSTYSATVQYQSASSDSEAHGHAGRERPPSAWHTLHGEAGVATSTLMFHATDTKTRMGWRVVMEGIKWADTSSIS